MMIATSIEDGAPSIEGVLIAFEMRRVLPPMPDVIAAFVSYEPTPDEVEIARIMAEEMGVESALTVINDHSAVLSAMAGHARRKVPA